MTKAAILIVGAFLLTIAAACSTTDSGATAGEDAPLSKLTAGEAQAVEELVLDAYYRGREDGRHSQCADMLNALDQSASFWCSAENINGAPGFLTRYYCREKEPLLWVCP